MTPGLAYNASLLESSEHNFLASLYLHQEGTSESAGIAFTDISTGTIQIAQGDMAYAETLLSQYAPREILVQRGTEKKWKPLADHQAYFSTMDDWAFVHAAAEEKVKTHFGVESLKGFGAENLPLAVCAVGAMLLSLIHISEPTRPY